MQIREIPKYQIGDEVRVLPVLNVGYRQRQGKVLKVKHSELGSYPLYVLDCGGEYFGDEIETV